ncbi:Qat anti-phage system QueC-like protein QatC [Cytophaga aurantiaca]|uniref:Qat anti-phage system QueC-like protein QatC n=1 Tax=Cytophaga aurantiaca TaxID=29530 RepID=UPI00037115DD|nr:Qat anti-phage system QueC-like protein QatC [Cytophaga aurantiaca]
MKINVSVPTINSKNIIESDIICSQLNGTSKIEIAFEDLLPYVNPTNKKALDFFLIASFIYGIDRFIERHANSIDGWSRELHISLPVYEMQAWATSTLHLEQLLSFLTGDHWKIEFKVNTLNLPIVTMQNIPNESAQINLFSGGLDSLIGAIDFLKEHDQEKLMLVSHFDPHISARQEQIILREKLNEKYPERFSFIPSVSVSLSTSNIEKEKTFRSRSLLFIGIALLAGTYSNASIMVPENGTVSLNFPLSASRRGSCSTRTTHPTYLKGINQLLDKIGINNKVENPYDLCTKGEMVNNCKDLDFLKLVVIYSNSCGKRGHRVNWSIKDRDHCGVCMPCIYRQAALQDILDTTKYGNSINKNNTGRKVQTPFLLSKQGQDFNACLSFIRKDFSDNEIRDELLTNGINDIIKIDDYVNLMKRTRSELKKWINSIGSSTIKNKAGIQ